MLVRGPLQMVFVQSGVVANSSEVGWWQTGWNVITSNSTARSKINPLKLFWQSGRSQTGAWPSSGVSFESHTIRTPLAACRSWRQFCSSCIIWWASFIMKEQCGLRGNSHQCRAVHNFVNGEGGNIWGIHAWLSQNFEHGKTCLWTCESCYKNSARGLRCQWKPCQIYICHGWWHLMNIPSHQPCHHGTNFVIWSFPESSHPQRLPSHQRAQN